MHKLEQLSYRRKSFESQRIKGVVKGSTRGLHEHNALDDVTATLNNMHPERYDNEAHMRYTDINESS